MLIGAVGSLLFVLACWFGLRQSWGFVLSLALASAIWLLVVLIPRWIDHSPSWAPGPTPRRIIDARVVLHQSRSRTQTSPRNYPGSCSQREPKSAKATYVKSA